jgi:dipeptidyl aminopeptidase/acylaminoacyl peptidase
MSPHAARRRLEADDLLDIAAIRDAQISPDGTRVAYVVRTEVRGSDRHCDTIWLAFLEPGSGVWSVRPLTDGAHADTTPRWAPGGEAIAFTSDRSGRGQVHLLDIDSGRQAQLTDLPAGASVPVWSPDGTRIAVLSVDRRHQDVPVNELIRHVRRLPYRTPSGGWSLDRFEHIWIVDVSSGQAGQLTSGAWNDGDAAWSPDGRRIAFTSLRHGGPVLPLSENAVYLIDSTPVASRVGTSDDAAIAITAGIESVGAPSWSPDGTRIACSGRAPGRWLASNSGIFVADVDGTTAPRRLDRPSDAFIGACVEFETIHLPGLAPTWTADGSGILFSATEAGRLGLYRLDVESLESRVVIGGDHAIAHVSVTADGGRIVYLANDWTHPGDLFAADADGSGPSQITHLNDGLIDDFDWSTPEPQAVLTSDGRFTLDTWLFRPIDFDPARTYPLVQLVHGGPDGTFGPTFRFTVQHLANHGFNVQLVNCRGGLSYGPEFDAALDGHYGVNDERDFWDALDVAIAAGGVDPERIGIHGHSYGGFMAAWMPGRTDRYKASVASAIMANFTTQSLTAFYGGTHSWSDGGQWPDMWADAAEWWRRSPMAYVPNIKAPILLLMGEEDRITTPFEHEQFFAALLSEGKTAEMVRFVGADHTVSTSGAPSVRAERERSIVDWFERYLGHPR